MAHAPQQQTAPLPPLPDPPAAPGDTSGLVLSVRAEERPSFVLEYRANPDDPASLVSGTFHFKTRDELTLEQQLSLARNAQAMQRIDTDLGTLTDADVKALAASIRQAAWDVLHDVPQHVFEQLNDGHLVALLAGFGDAPA